MNASAGKWSSSGMEIIRQLHRDDMSRQKLSGEFGVDTSTIRRDLDVLVRSGQAERTHGGAKAVGGAALDVPYAVKEFERRQQKVAIAAHATARVREGDSVVLDSGSTTFQVAMALRNIPDLTFITNDLRIALLAAVPDVRLFLAGGELLNSVFTLTGPRATEFFSDFSATWAFLGADALDSEAGITNTNTREVPVKRAMIEAASTSIVVADSSKFESRTLARVAALDEVDHLVTDVGLDTAIAAKYGSRLERVYFEQ